LPDPFCRLRSAPAASTAFGSAERAGAFPHREPASRSPARHGARSDPPPGSAFSGRGPCCDAQRLRGRRGGRRRQGRSSVRRACDPDRTPLSAPLRKFSACPRGLCQAQTWRALFSSMGPWLATAWWKYGSSANRSGCLCRSRLTRRRKAGSIRAMVCTVSAPSYPRVAPPTRTRDRLPFVDPICLIGGRIGSIECNAFAGGPPTWICPVPGETFPSRNSSFRQMGVSKRKPRRGNYPFSTG